MNKNPQEGKPEQIPTKEEVLEVISRFVENATFVRELSDEQGLYLLEVKADGKKPGEVAEYLYIRKGIHPNRNETAETTIYVTQYEDGMPIAGETLAGHNSETGEWTNA